jgi:serine protease Do
MNHRLSKNLKSYILSGDWRKWLAIFIIAILLFSGSAIEGKSSPLQASTPGSFSALVKQAGWSVVNISAVRIVKQSEEPPPLGSDDPLQEFFNRFFRHQIPRGSRQNSLGTGFIIDKKGLF